MIQGVFKPFRDLDHLFHIYAGVNARTVQHVKQVFGCDITRRLRRERAAADAAGAGIQDPYAGLDRRERIGDSGVARVVEMTAERHLAHDFAHRIDAALHFPGVGDAYAVGQPDFAGAEFGCALCGLNEFFEWHLALERAPPGCADRDGARGVRRIGDFHHAFEDLQRLFRRRILVPLAERVGGNDDKIHFLALGFDGALKSAVVESQADIFDPLVSGNQAHQLRRIRHLRHSLGIDEGGHFHAADPRIDQPMDEFEFAFGIHHGRVVLQTVAQSDFHDFNAYIAHDHFSETRRRFMQPFGFSGAVSRYSLILKPFRRQRKTRHFGRLLDVSPASLLYYVAFWKRWSGLHRNDLNELAYGKRS